MKGFIPYYTDGSNRPQALEYLPAGTLTPKKGMALVFTSGKLAKIGSNTAKPLYICMKEDSVANVDGAAIPVLKINPDMVFETQLQENADSNTVLGAKVGIYSTDGLQATKYNSSGMATVVAMPAGEGTASKAGDPIFVRFL